MKKKKQTKETNINQRTYTTPPKPLLIFPFLEKSLNFIVMFIVPCLTVNFVLSLKHKATTNTKIQEHIQNRNVTDTEGCAQHNAVF